MEIKKKRFKLFEAKYFGLILGLFIVLFFILLSSFTSIIDNIEVKVLDIHFRYKNLVLAKTIQQGVSFVEHNPHISQDILIVGIDSRTLSKFGRWPFPRYTHSYLLNTFSRIKNVNNRENSVFLDIFFNEPGVAVDDGTLISSIKENGRVFLETLLDEVPPPPASRKDFFKREQILTDTYGEITNIVGDWEHMDSFPGIEPPLQPYARAAHGYGHANYQKDDDEIYRRQPLVAKYSVPVREIKLRDLTTGLKIDRKGFQRIAWEDKDNIQHSVTYPLTQKAIAALRTAMKANAPVKKIDTNNDGTPDDSYYVLHVYQDHFVPAITLSLALNYFNKKLSDIEVNLGKYIFIPHPQHFNVKTGVWEPYKRTITEPVYDDKGQLVKKGVYAVVPEIRIPIDATGSMLVNFMGPPSIATPGERQTFPIRSYSGYASNPPGLNAAKWPRTRALGNKIIMVGAFSRGMAADEKPTPVGLMYGVEIHANALNTILMGNFLVHVPFWVDLGILLFMVMLVSFLASRLSTIWAFLVTIFLILFLFVANSVIFDRYAYIVNFTSPALATFFSLITIIVYRVMTEEKDKKRIRNMFGTYVSPAVVDQILDNPPELGGVDKELTVFFSDIRGFTTLSESMTPQELVQILNRYLTAMTDIILAHDGTLDKYEGDAIMAFWGAPLPQKDHALRACRSALEQMKALQHLNEEFPDKQINIGIGLNTGKMTVGNMGSLQRMDYTLIGDHVNLGARLEGTNKQYRTNIIISEYTYGYVKDQMIVRELDNIRVKGKNKPVLIYELIDEKEMQDPDNL